MKIKYYTILFFSLIIIGYLIFIVHKNKVLSNIRKGERINVLLIVHDNIKPLKYSEPIVLLSYNVKTREIFVFYVPTDLWIDNEHKKIHKLNHLYKYYFKKNKQNIDKTCYKIKGVLERVLDIKIPFYMQLDYNDIENLVDRIGGVKLEIGNKIFYKNLEEKLELNFMAGVQSLNGKDTVSFLRFQDMRIENIVRHQYFIASFFRVFKKSFINFKLYSTYKMFHELKFSNLTKLDILFLLVEYNKINIDNLIRVYLPTYLKDFKLYFNKDVFNNLYYKQNNSLNDKVTVEVLNASNTTGAAMKTSRILRKNKIDVLSWGNYNNKQAATLVIDRTGDFWKARHVARILQCKDVLAIIDNSRYVDVSVIIGRAHSKMNGEYFFEKKEEYKVFKDKYKQVDGHLMSGQVS